LDVVSGGETFDSPTFSIATITHTVMQATGAALPKLQGFGRKAIPSPVEGTRDIVGLCVLGGDLALAFFEDLAVG
jgi:hypothetical protein